MNEDSIQEKQKYLRQNILESGYDPNDFVTFLQQTENIDHIDIQGWSKKRIIQLVAAYQQYKYYTSKQHNQTSTDKKKIFPNRQTKITVNKEEEKTIPKEELISINSLLQTSGKIKYEKEKMIYYEQLKHKIEYPKYSPIFDFEFKGKCKCIKQKNLIQSDIRIQVPHFQQVETPGLFLGFGSKTEFWFTVRSNIKKATSVKRLLQDFDWLSLTLIRLYPYLALPQLVEYKKQIQNPIQKRRIELQEYLKALAGRKDLYKSNLFYEFLTVHQDNMQKMKKGYDGIGFSKGVSVLKSSDGEVEMEYTKRVRQFQENCQEYSKNTMPIHQKFSETLTKTIQSLEMVVTNINYLVDYFAQLHQKYNGLINKFPEHKSNDYNQILVNMNNLFLGISQSAKGHAKILQTHLKEYFKTNVLNDKNIIRLQRYIKEEEKTYLDYKYNLLRKKQRLFTEPQKWDINLKNITSEQLSQLKINKEKAYEVMLPRETFQQNQIKCWIGYLYTMFVKEFDTYIKESTQRYAHKYKAFVTELLINDKNYLESLTKFVSESRKLTK